MAAVKLFFLTSWRDCGNHESVFYISYMCAYWWCGNWWIKPHWIVNISTKKTVQCGKHNNNIIAHVLSYTFVHTHSHNNHSPTHYLLVCPPSTMIYRQSSSVPTCAPFSLPKINDQDSWGQPWAQFITRINVSQSHHIWHALKCTHILCIVIIIKEYGCVCYISQS